MAVGHATYDRCPSLDITEETRELWRYYELSPGIPFTYKERLHFPHQVELAFRIIRSELQTMAKEMKSPDGDN